MRVLGIDPGLNAMGWGVIDWINDTLSLKDYGVLRTSPNENIPQRLAVLYQLLTEIFETYQPTATVVEQTFVNVNPKTSLRLGLARGVALLVPGQRACPVFEYAPNTIKATITGQGHAKKAQIAYMVQQYLKEQKSFPKDASDALAIAITHIFLQKRRAKIA